MDFDVSGQVKKVIFTYLSRALANEGVTSTTDGEVGRVEGAALQAIWLRFFLIYDYFVFSFDFYFCFRLSTGVGKHWLICRCSDIVVYIAIFAMKISYYLARYVLRRILRKREIFFSSYKETLPLG